MTPTRWIVPVGLSWLAGLAHAWAMAWPWPGVSWLGWRTGEPIAWLQWLALVGLAWLCRQAPSWRSAALLAWLFGTAWLAGTFWWLFISMNTYGGLPAWMAAFSVWALAAFLALYTAAAGGLVWRWRAASPFRYALVFAAVWLLAEWARGRWLTGFPWGAAGYAQVDAMAVWAPWVGVYGMGALSAGLAAAVAAGAWWRGWWPRVLIGVLVLPMVWPSAGRWLAEVQPAFTRSTGAVPVALLQGNIPQDEKFQPGGGVPLALDWYLTATGEALQRLDARGGGLVVAPETAIPLLPQQMDPAWWAQWEAQIASSQSAVLIGLPMGSWQAGYTNSVAGWTPSLDTYRYDKHHLVPFGEFVPPLFRWFTEWMDIPLGDFNRGALVQPSFEWMGQRWAPNVCYEDLFGEELAASFRHADAAPTLLVNVSNIAWFGNTVAIDQHRHIARLRSLELQRSTVRATNTGATAVIDPWGRVIAEYPRLTRGVLDSEVEGRTGLTPYAWWASRFGLWPLVLLALGVLGWHMRATAPRPLK